MPKTAVNRAAANRAAMIADRFFEIDITALERFLIFICGVGCVDDFKERNFGVKALPGRAGECRQKLILFRNRTHIMKSLLLLYVFTKMLPFINLFVNRTEILRN